MTLPRRKPDPIGAFNECLLRMQQGEPLDSVLRDFPDLAPEVRLELDLVRDIWDVRGSNTVPIQALRRSRENLVALAQRYRTVPRPPWWRVWPRAGLGWLRRSAALKGILAALLLTLVLVVLTGAALRALPGEPLHRYRVVVEELYPLLAPTLEERLVREVALDERRAADARHLLQQGVANEQLSIPGLLVIDETSWQVAGLPVMPPPGLDPAAYPRDVVWNARVELRGSSNPQLLELEPRLYQVRGKVEQLEGQNLRLSGVWVGMPADAALIVAPGDMVRVTLRRLGNGEWRAERLEVLVN